MTQDTPAALDANALEAMARERPNDMFLKGSGVLKLTGAIRTLEREVRELRGRLPHKDLAFMFGGAAPKGDSNG